MVAFARALGRLGRLDLATPLKDAAGPAALSAPQAEALRRMLLAVVADPRLVLARVAEQLWLLRAARQADGAERRRLAVQTREVYAPLANRLGLAVLKWELEDYAFRYLEPDDYRRIAGSLAEKRSDRERYIEELKALLERELRQAGIRAEVHGRPKHIYSIWRKMQKKSLAFERVFDVRAVRVLCDTVAECYAALGIVHGLWHYLPGEFDDYIATPKANGYRSIHTAVVGPAGKAVEVQIRTREMHDKAELGVAAHWRYKEGGVRDAGLERKVEQLRALLAPETAADADPLERVGATLFREHVYVFSPKGDVVELPEGATPLDFAYHVHTSLGHRCRGARVDGRMVPLDQRLENGVRVEIITGKEPQPSRDWLVESRGFLASKSARGKVRAWFRLVDHDEHLRAGRAIVERELARRSGTAPPAIGELATEMGLAGPDELYVALGAGDLSGAQLGAALARRAGRGAAGGRGRAERRDAEARVRRGHPRHGGRRPPVAVRALLPAGAAGADRGLRDARPRHDDPPRRLRQPRADAGAPARPGAAGRVGHRPRAALPGAVPGAGLRPARARARRQRRARGRAPQHRADDDGHERRRPDRRHDHRRAGARPRRARGGAGAHRGPARRAARPAALAAQRFGKSIARLSAARLVRSWPEGFEKKKSICLASRCGLKSGHLFCAKARVAWVHGVTG